MDGIPEDALDAEYRRVTSEALAADDWHTASSWAKGWKGNGGAGLLDPWLVDVASALVHGQPRTAVHALDLALRHWVPDEPDRCALHFVRHRVVWLQLRDPKTAMPDLEAARTAPPTWLAATVEADVEPLAVAAAASRKRKPSVAPARPYVGSDDPLSPRTTPDARSRRRLPPGTRPDLWPLVDRYLAPPEAT